MVDFYGKCVGKYNTPFVPWIRNGIWNPTKRFSRLSHSSWWFQPSWKKIVKMGSSSPNRDENKKYLKPPPSIGWASIFHQGTIVLARPNWLPVLFLLTVELARFTRSAAALAACDVVKIDSMRGSSQLVQMLGMLIPPLMTGVLIMGIWNPIGLEVSTVLQKLMAQSLHIGLYEP